MQLHHLRWCEWDVWLVGLALLLATLLPASVARGQSAFPTYSERPDLYAQLEDGTRFGRIRSNGDTTPANWFSTGYEFQMSADADTTCETDYSIAGFARNGQRIPLRNWKNKRIINLDESILSFNSRTVGFPLVPGDTLSFFREIWWKDPRSNYQDSNNYHSFDTLTYAVELVRSSDSVRIALVDSIGVLPSPLAGVPTIHGTRPIIAHIRYVVPSSLAGGNAFLRVRVRARGDGKFYFTRKEKPSVALWQRLQDPYWINYLTQFGQLYAKPSAPGSPDVAAPKATLDVRLAGGTHDQISIDFSMAPDGGPTTVAIHDGDGRLLFYPYTTPASHEGMGHASYRFESSGLYLVSLMHNGRLVHTQAITIGR